MFCYLDCFTYLWAASHEKRYIDQKMSIKQSMEQTSAIHFKPRRNSRLGTLGNDNQRFPISWEDATSGIPIASHVLAVQLKPTENSEPQISGLHFIQTHKRLLEYWPGKARVHTITLHENESSIYYHCAPFVQVWANLGNTRFNFLVYSNFCTWNCNSTGSHVRGPEKPDIEAHSVVHQTLGKEGRQPSSP